METEVERAAITLRSLSERFRLPYDNDLQRAEEIGRALQADVLPYIEGKTVEDMAYFQRLGFKPAESKNHRKLEFHTFGDDRRPWINLVHLVVGAPTLRHRHTGPCTAHVISGVLTVDRFKRLGTGAIEQISKKSTVQAQYVV